MVSNQKSIKKPGIKDTKTSDGTDDEKKDLEKVINNVINTCKDIISKTNGAIKDKQNMNKKPPSKSIKPVQNNASNVTLETVAKDMTNILKDLRNHLHTMKDKHDSYSDVTPKLEESFLNDQNTKNTSSFFKDCKTIQPNKTCAKPAAANNNKPKTNSPSNASSTNKCLAPSKPNSNSPSNTSNTNKCLTPSSIRSNTSKMSSSSKQSRTSSVYRTATPRSVYNPLGLIKTDVERAMRENRTFTVRGVFPAVRKALLQRGWVEKLHMSFRDRVHEDLKKFQTYSIQELVELLRNKEIAENCKRLIKSKLLANHQVDFYWGFNYDSFKECPDKVKLTKINKFRRELFSYTSKLGLCDANKKSIWFKIPGIANLNHPRSYSLVANGDTPEFIKDFNRTAAMALLKWVVKNNTTGEFRVLSPSGKIPLEVFDFAINECYKFIKMAEHEDIDTEIKEALEFEWNEFLEYFYKTVHIGNHFKTNNETSEIDMVRKANYILTKLRDFYPYLDMDGIMNMWILKPTNGSQGVGIHICRTLQYILKTIKGNPNRRYIIQKYIERPLLIYNTKFDIRQWFLISSSMPLTIWMYKVCYLRFSSQTYNLRKLHESIHLTNNCVQSRYPKTNRDMALPAYNMWDSKQFKCYLSDIGYPNAFDGIVYPGMKQCVIAAVIMYQDKLDRRKNCFELYGADFMLTEDFKPWLLEINSNPALHASTPVTARMCPIVLEDVIKVVIDFEKNRNADTGAFELIYQKDLPKSMPSKDLQVKGTPLKTDYFYTPSGEEAKPVVQEKRHSVAKMSTTDSIDYVKQIGRGMRKTLEDLLEILRKEKQKRHERKNTGVATILSRIITETKGSQTEYKLQGKLLSETLIKSQILEVEEVGKPELKKRNADTIRSPETKSVTPKSRDRAKTTNNSGRTKPQNEPSTVGENTSNAGIKVAARCERNVKTPELQNVNTTVKKTPKLQNVNTTVKKPSELQNVNTTVKKPSELQNVNNTVKKAPALKNVNNYVKKTPELQNVNTTVNKPPELQNANNTIKKTSELQNVNNTVKKTSEPQKVNNTIKKPSEVQYVNNPIKKTSELQNVNNTVKKTPEPQKINNTVKKPPELPNVNNPIKKTSELQNVNNTVKKPSEPQKVNNTIKKLPELQDVNNPIRKTSELQNVNNTVKKPPELQNVNKPIKITSELQNVNTVKKTPDLQKTNNSVKKTPELQNVNNTVKKTPDLQKTNNTVEKTPELQNVDNTVKKTPKLQTVDNTVEKKPELQNVNNTIKNTVRNINSFSSSRQFTDYESKEFHSNEVCQYCDCFMLCSVPKMDELETLDPKIKLGVEKLKSIPTVSSDRSAEIRRKSASFESNLKHLSSRALSVSNYTFSVDSPVGESCSFEWDFRKASSIISSSINSNSNDNDKPQSNSVISGDRQRSNSFDLNLKKPISRISPQSTTRYDTMYQDSSDDEKLLNSTGPDAKPAQIKQKSSFEANLKRSSSKTLPKTIKSEAMQPIANNNDKTHNNFIESSGTTAQIKQNNIEPDLKKASSKKLPKTVRGDTTVPQACYDDGKIQSICYVSSDTLLPVNQIKNTESKLKKPSSRTLYPKANKDESNSTVSSDRPAQIKQKSSFESNLKKPSSKTLPKTIESESMHPIASDDDKMHSNSIDLGGKTAQIKQHSIESGLKKRSSKTLPKTVRGDTTVPKACYAEEKTQSIFSVSSDTTVPVNQIKNIQSKLKQWSSGTLPKTVKRDAINSKENDDESDFAVSSDRPVHINRKNDSFESNLKKGSSKTLPKTVKSDAINSKALDDQSNSTVSNDRPVQKQKNDSFESKNSGSKMLPKAINDALNLNATNSEKTQSNLNESNLKKQTPPNTTKCDMKSGVKAKKRFMAFLLRSGKKSNK